MKVAMFEPFPRTCGVTAWAFHAAQGFRDLGHACDVVSFTKSGRIRATTTRDGNPRPGWQWWPDAPDVNRKWADAGATLDEYDLIVWNEPKNGPLDSNAKRESKLPEYIYALQETRTPWMTVLHDKRAYDKNRAPYLPWVGSAGNFTGDVIECRPGSYANAEWALGGYVKQIQSWPWLPYQRRGRHLTETRLRTISIGGRATPHKGFHALAYVADQLRLPEYMVRIFGSEAGGMGPCYTYRIYEALTRHHGWKGFRAGNPKTETTRDERTLSINNFGSVNAPWPWWAQKNGYTVLYDGQYMDAITEWSKSAIAVQLSTDDVVTTFEYTTLEALDAGCLMVLPDYYKQDMQGAPYEVAWLHEYTGATIRDKTGISWDNEHARNELIQVTGSACYDIESGAHNPNHNWQVMEQYNAPRHVANAILTMIGA